MQFFLENGYIILINDELSVAMALVVQENSMRLLNKSECLYFSISLGFTGCCVNNLVNIHA